MKRLLIMVACFVWVAPTQAASFDCAKAGSKVEKLICADAELSKLDDELSSAYKSALKDEKQAVSIRQSQKQWLEERNGCVDAGCVQDAYRQRIGQLKPDQSLAKEKLAMSRQPEKTSVDSTVSLKKYPPYPSVWDWVIPERDKISGLGVDLYKLDSGDVLFMYTLHDKKHDKWSTVEPMTLFGRLKAKNENVASGIFGHTLSILNFNDGTAAHLESKEDASKIISFGIPLSEGSKLRQGSMQRIGPAYSSCYYGPARDSYYIINSKREVLRNVVIFKILDKPKHIDIGKGCISESVQSFTTRVESIDAGHIARSLDDGGFVMQVEPGVLIRFDKDFNSKSSLINDKYFVLDNTIKETDEEADKEPETDYWIYINRITGKRYRKGPNYPYDYQSVVDDLYNYLHNLQINKGATK